MISNKIYILIFLFSACITHLCSQELSYIQYTTNDGLPSMKVYDLMQDSNGLIWMGTENGLVSFDGDEFTTYQHTELKDKDFIETKIDPQGRVFFANISGQIGYVENEELVFLDLDTKGYKSIDFVVFKNKLYLADAVGGLNSMLEFSEKDDGKIDLKPTDIFLVDNENNTSFKAITDQVFKCNEESFEISCDKDAGMGFISGDKKYLLSILCKNTLIKVDDVLFEYYLSIKKEGCLKFGDNFFIKKPIGFDFYSPKRSKEIFSFFKDQSINTLFIDAENNLWVSTPNSGLFKISNFFTGNFSSFTVKGLDKGIYDLLRLEDGTIVMGTTSGEMLLLSKDGKVIEDKLIGDKRPVRLTENKDFVFAYNNYSIANYNKKTAQYKVNGSSFLNNRALYVDDTLMYLGSRLGVVIASLSTFWAGEKFPVYPKDKSGRVLDLHKDKATNKIYVGTTEGLFSIDSDTLVPVKIELLNGEVISCLSNGAQNSIWVGTSNGIASNIRNDSLLMQFQIGTEALKYRINSIELYKDELLVSTNYGLVIIDLLTNKQKTINDYNFLPNSEVFVCKVINDTYWIGTKEDLTILTKEQINDLNTRGPILSLKDMQVNGFKFEYQPGLELKYNENNIQFNFRNISYNSGKGKALKYRIPLIDSIWITTLDPSIRLPALQPGKYTIEVFGLNSIGQESERVEIQFVVQIPWWKEWWAFALGAAILLTIGNLILVYRARGIRKEEALKRDYLTQINRIKDQALQLQMNPHFIFNCLNAIQGFIGTDEEEKAMNFLARFARLIRLIFEHSKGNSISLDDEIEFMELYINLEKLRFKDKVAVQLNIDTKLDEMRDVINIPPLLIQPIVENSFKHGLFHKDGEGILSIDYRLTSEHNLQIIVEDNGIGRKMAAEISKPKRTQHNSSGLTTTKERIDLLNYDKNERVNSISIEDLYDTSGNPAGTKTTLNLSI